MRRDDQLLIIMQTLRIVSIGCSERHRQIDAPTGGALENRRRPRSLGNDHSAAGRASFLPRSGRALLVPARYRARAADAAGRLPVARREATLPPCGGPGGVGTALPAPRKA